MARIEEPSHAQVKGWAKWVRSRPPAIRAVAEKFDPWSLYRMKSTGQRVRIYSFTEGEPVTLTVLVLAEFNLVLFETQVFGIAPEDLEPCELPGATEPVGAVLQGDEVRHNIDALRVLVRPDLWAMGEDGKAKLKQ